jgi:ribonuclease G
MEEKEHQKELLAYLKECVSKDSVKTDVIDMTKLQLVEMTRRRIKKPLYEVMRIE